SPIVEETLGKIRLVENPDIPSDPLRFWVTATLRMKDGRVFSERCTSFRGSIANPMTREERLVKYEDCAKRVLNRDDRDRLLDMAERLEQLEDVRELTALLIQTPCSE